MQNGYGERDPRGQFIELASNRQNPELLVLGAAVKLLQTIGDEDEKRIATAADAAIRREINRGRLKHLLILPS